MKGDAASPVFRFARDKTFVSPGVLTIFVHHATGNVTRRRFTPPPVHFLTGWWNAVTGYLPRGIFPGKRNGHTRG